MVAEALRFRLGWDTVPFPASERAATARFGRRCLHRRSTIHWRGLAARPSPGAAEYFASRHLSASVSSLTITIVRKLVSFFLTAVVAVAANAGVPVTISPVVAKHGMVVAAHPQSVEAGVAVLKAGGNAVDAAVATSLAVGVAEAYGSGLGGKLMLLYFEAKS